MAGEEEENFSAEYVANLLAPGVVAGALLELVEDELATGKYKDMKPDDANFAAGKAMAEKLRVCLVTLAQIVVVKP
jgi:hypothetical protein